MTQGHDPYAPFRVADFRYYMLAGMISTVGFQMQSVAVGWELYERTGSAMDLGLVGLVQFVPLLLLALPAGHAADRYSRKTILLVAQGLLLAASAGLALLSYLRGPVWLMYLCLLLAGIAQAVNRPARWSYLPQLVPGSLLPSAVAWNTSGWQTAAVAGPALGGLLIAVTRGATWVYLVDAACCLIVILLLGMIRAPPGARVVEPVSLRSLVAGFEFVRKSDLILAAITLDMFAVLLGGATALLPIFARDILHVGPTGLGWLRAAPSIGAMMMALMQAHRPPLRRSGRTLLWAVAGFGVATIVFGLSRNPLSLVCHAPVDRGARQHQRRGPDHARADPDARRDARPGLGGQRPVHRLVERAGGVRVGRDGAAFRSGRLGGRRRHRHDPGRACRCLDLAPAAAARCDPRGGAGEGPRAGDGGGVGSTRNSTAACREYV